MMKILNRPEMLKRNLESETAGDFQNLGDRLSRESLWTLMLSMTFLALFPVRLGAQATPTTVPGSTTSPSQGFVYGTGVQAPLQFAGQTELQNFVGISFGASAMYDDNVLGRNTDRVGDEALSLDSQINVLRETEHLGVSFDYTPFFLLYRQLSNFDQLNQAANFGLTYQLSPRFILGLHDTFGFQYGAYPSLGGNEILSGPLSPTGLNQLILPYSIRTLSNTTGLDLTFMKSPRTSLTIFGGYNEREFGSQTTESEPLYSGVGGNIGLSYSYRITEHTSFGLLAIHQDTTYQGGEVFGYRQRSQIESGYVSVSSRLSPTLSVTLFGGPQYFHTLGQVPGGSNVAGEFEGSGGGSITKEAGKTAISLALQRSVSDGGGLYTSVIGTSITLGVRRRLVGRWEADLRGGAAESDTSLFQLANETTKGITAAIDVTRPIRKGSSFHMTYATMHQLSTGSLAIFPNFDRNQFSIGIDYRLKNIPLGR
jgi:hypothetical protein